MAYYSPKTVSNSPDLIFVYFMVDFEVIVASFEPREDSEEIM
jgi:hypothetical protein